MGTVHGLLTLVLSAQLSAALPPDSVESLRNRARRAEARFERLARQLAPVSWNWSGGSDCDEIVGRFCLRFDSTSTPPAAEEAARVVDARREAVEAARRYFGAAAGDRRAAGPLVRLLIADGRATEAVSGAGAFAALSVDTLWSHMLLGLALHAAGEDSIAERHFITALGAMTDEERRKWLDPRWLLHPDEHRRVRRLHAPERAEYERVFWLLSDPLWFTSANERWNEHIARHVQARLLDEVPVVSGMMSWGSDLDELTIRYGTPTARARPGGAAPRSGMVEYWDSAQRAFDPERLSDGIPATPDPGMRPVLYSARTRSGYALLSVERVIEVSHQVTRFTRGDSVFLRVDAIMPVESTSSSMRAALFAYDSAFTRRARVAGSVSMDGDSARTSLIVSAPAGRVIYSIEMVGDSGAVSGRARYAVEAYLPQSGPVISDLLIARAFDVNDMPESFGDPRLRAIETLRVHAGDTIGIYAEVGRLRSGAAVSVDVLLRPADGPSLLGRFARWIGRSIGVIGPAASEPRIGWQAQSHEGRAVIALNLPLDGERQGLQELVVRVTESGSGVHTETLRRILVIEAEE